MLLLKINSALKDFLLFTRLPLLLKPLRNLLKFLSHFSLLSSWIQQHKNIPFSDFYKPRRTYSDRFKLYKHISDSEIQDCPVYYLEFGVASGSSFKWWLDENKHSASRFWGFDTFEGLPEDWHFYSKGDMSYAVPQPDDKRATFIKGLFQDTLYDFVKNFQRPTDTKMVIHMDADLYSSTLFALTMLAPYLKAGDILFFDEFNVPNHEFAAWNDFVRSYYIKYEVLGAVNNFYQVAFLLK
jgi:O-methyltransferase